MGGSLAGLALGEGISGFLLMADVSDRRDLHRFAEEVAPAVRELVEAERTVPPRPSAEEPVEVASALPEASAPSISLPVTATSSSPSTPTCARSCPDP